MERKARQPTRTRRRARLKSPGLRYDANIDHILAAAAAVFAQKSFGLASIRDIAARARISFPRIYYYLRNKEELLYLISKRAIEQLLSSYTERSAGVTDPAARLRIFIENHFDFQLAHMAETKVMIQEADKLSSVYAEEVDALKHEYSRCCQSILAEMARAEGAELSRERSRIATSLLFGAMNWFYTWYDPSRDDLHRGRIVDELYRLFAGHLGERPAGAADTAQRTTERSPSAT